MFRKLYLCPGGRKGVGAVTLNRVRAFVRSFCRDESGPTATEYAVMLALIIVVSMAAIGTFGLNVRDSVFGSVNTMFGS